jgi:hypothetical protein
VNAPSAAEVQSLLPHLSERERADLFALLSRDKKRWRPLPGPQTDAYQSTADIIGYGGAAGGGKTDLACGKSIEDHRKIMILRRVGTELSAIEDRLEELFGTKDGYNSTKGIWRQTRSDGKALQIELGSVPNAGDEKKYQGRPHDLIVFDEAANFLELQVRFLLGWLRTTVVGQRCQALLTFNPPTSAEGRWIVDFFGPWLDDKHPNPAVPGELRWFATVAGNDLEVDSGKPFVIADGEPQYDFNPADYAESPDLVIQPMSRTFIPSRVRDNPFLTGTGYMSTLQALPEPLRSQMLNGDFKAGMEDDIWQVIPTRWVELAQARWKPLSPKPEMLSLGVDVARGGKDKTVIYRRHEGWWFDEPLEYPGAETPNGPMVAGLAIAANRNHSPIHIDVIGVGSSPYDFLKEARQQVLGVNVSEKSGARDKSGRLGFFNQRSEHIWRLRELLDPEANNNIALPPSKRLLADLCAPKWKLRGSQVYVESREDIVDRIKRSPDHLSALALACINTPKMRNMPGMSSRKPRDYDPLA